MQTGTSGNQDGSSDKLAQRARKSWLLLMVSVMAATAVGVPLLNGVLGLDEHHHPAHRQRSGVEVLISSGLVLLLGVTVLAIMVRKVWRGQGMFAPALIMGLRRRDQRRVHRAVRSGTPTADPALAPVERDTAKRLVKHGRRRLLIFVVAFLGELVAAAVHSGTAARLFFLAGALMFLVFAFLQAWQLRGARRYLAQPPPAEPAGDGN